MNGTETKRSSLYESTKVDLVSESITNISQKEAPEGTKGWTVVAGCFAALFATQGYYFSWGIYLEYYNKYIFVDQMSTLSWIGSIWLAMAVIFGPVYGYLAYKFGYRWLLISALIFSTLAMMLASISTKIWQLLLTQGLLAGLGAGISWFPCISAPQQYFDKRRGLAVGIAISGSGFGGLIMSNIVEAVISSLGIRWSLRVIGFINFALLSFAVCVVRPLNPPPPCTLIQSINLKPFRNMQFCLLFAIQLIGSFAINMPSSYLPSYAEYIHLDSWIGSSLSSILCGLLIVGKIGGGVMGDHFGRFNMAMVCISLTGVVFLVLWLPASNSGEVWAFAALFGLFGGGYISLIPSVVVQCVGIEEVEASNGLLYFAWIFGGLGSSPICAALINIDPTYSYAIAYSGVLMVISGALAAVLRITRVGWSPFIKA